MVLIEKIDTVGIRHICTFPFVWWTTGDYGNSLFLITLNQSNYLSFVLRRGIFAILSWWYSFQQLTVSGTTWVVPSEVRSLTRTAKRTSTCAAWSRWEWLHSRNHQRQFRHLRRQRHCRQLQPQRPLGGNLCYDIGRFVSHDVEKLTDGIGQYIQASVSCFIRCRASIAAHKIPLKKWECWESNVGMPVEKK